MGRWVGLKVRDLISEWRNNREHTKNSPSKRPRRKEGENVPYDYEDYDKSDD